ncbi:MAG: hypothetical protein H6R17_1517 [Proteobacteria bacterium]|nr:hypothetical protein [Pseudomonadota bacterium]
MPDTISIQAFPHFTGLAAAFPGLVAAAADSDIFLTPDWFSTLCEYGNTFAGKLQLIVANDRQSGATLCLPTVDGRNLQGLSNYYSSLFAPIGDPTTSNAPICQALGQWLYSQPQRWPQLSFQPLDTDHPFFDHMLAALRDAGYRADSYACFGNWHLDVAGRSHADYLASTPSRLRHTIERNRRKAQKAGGVDIRIHQQPGPALDAAIEHFAAIYRRSWKPAESHPALVSALCRLGAAKGWLRLAVLEFAGEAIAAQIWLVHRGKASIFKLAYVEGGNPFSAGTLLTDALMRQVIDIDGVSEVDYLSGDDAYKQDWMSHRRERRGIVAFDPRTLGGLLLAGKHQAGKMLRKNNARP